MFSENNIHNFLYSIHLFYFEKHISTKIYIKIMKTKIQT